MYRLPFLLSLLSLPIPGGMTSAAPSAPWRFFALGDLPYAPAEVPQLRRLFDAAVVRKTPFLIHLGDIKGGGEPCTDDNLKAIAAIFRAQPVPVIYTPGDNEWTDCHRKQAGRLNPRERLERVREIFFRDPEVLRLGTLGVSPPGAGARSDAYPELYAFMYQEVLFVVPHVVGSNNGDRADDPEAVAEFEARDQANLALLQRSSAEARARGAQAMVLLMQADPLFHKTHPPRGFASLRRALVQLMEDYPGPVLLIHGDTHRFKHDRPLIDPKTGTPFERFVRAEVPGSPVVGGLWITIAPDADEPFGVEEVYPMSLEHIPAAQAYQSP